MIKKLSVTYRATIDRRVPIEVKARAGKKKSIFSGKFHIIRDRLGLA